MLFGILIYEIVHIFVSALPGIGVDVWVGVREGRGEKIAHNKELETILRLRGGGQFKNCLKKTKYAQFSNTEKSAIFIREK